MKGSTQKADWRQCLDSSLPVLQEIDHENIIQHTDRVLEQNPRLRDTLAHFERFVDEPFTGITTDGNVRTNLFEKTDDDIPIEAITSAANDILEAATAEQRKLIKLSINARERRIWSNMHMYIFRFGMRLEDVDKRMRALVFKLLDTAMSPEGYEKAMTATQINAFLGSVVNAPKVLNQYSYNFAFFGEPSAAEPWGWVLFGHHLCLSFFVRNKQIVISPVFTGAEPNMIDDGTLAGTRLFVLEQDLGLKLIRALPSDQLKKAQLWDTLDPPDKPADTRLGWTRGHLFQDNRIIPLEGICLKDVDESARNLVVDLVEHFVIYLPATARKNRLREVRNFIEETFFCWIGGTGDNDPFYYRIQSPVIICELEHIGGVFLANKKAEKFHTHTQVRTPNGGDYGFALQK